MSAERSDNSALIDLADELADIAGELGLSGLAKHVRAETQRRVGSQRLRVVVMGEIKHGKSSLINALVGRDALPTGVTPTTATVIEVRTGGRAGRFHFKADGTRESISRDRFDALARGKGRGKPVVLEHVSIKSSVPSFIELVDTPGINDIERFREVASRGQLSSADVLVVVLDATQALNRSELAFLRDAVAAVGGLAGSGARLVVVLNRIDLVAGPDHATLMTHVRTQLAGLGGRRPDSRDLRIFLTDAKAALRDPDDGSVGVRGVAQLREHLIALGDKRDALLPARTRSALLRHATLLAHNAAIQSRAVALETETLEREIEDVKQAIVGQQLDMDSIRELLDDGRGRVRSESAERLDQFQRQLETSARAHVDTANLKALTTHLPGALHDAFTGFAREESERLREALDELTRAALRTHGEAARRRLFQATLRMGFRGPVVYVDPPSITLEASLVAVSVVGTAVMYFGNLVTGLVMTVAGPLTTVALREKSLRNARARAKELIPQAVAEASKTLSETVSRVIDDHVRGIEEHLMLANEALGEQLAAVLQHARDALGRPQSEDDRKQRKRGAQQRSEALERRLAHVRGELEALPAADEAA